MSIADALDCRPFKVKRGAATTRARHGVCGDRRVSIGEYDAATQGQECQQGNQRCDSTKQFKILMVNAAMKPNLFIGCNMRPRLQRAIPAER